MIILILFAFIAGIVTILSPCILPVLPIILAGSATGGKRKPLGIVTGFVASFTFFTLFLSSLVNIFGISANFLRLFSIIIITLFGISLLIPKLQQLFEKLVSFTNQLSPKRSSNGFKGGLLIGLSLGLIWTPCVGPILASVISLALSGSVSQSAFFITLAYSLGTAIPMLIITYAGQRLLQKLPILVKHTAQIQQVFGLIMVIMGMSLWLNLDRKFQTWVLTTFPNYGTNLTAIENNQLIQNQLQQLWDDSSPKEANDMQFSPLNSANYKQAPDISGGTNWLNSEPLTINDLKGKVVLIDFWTYPCINCIRTLPYVTNWYETYKNQDFVIIGVHSPEFEFEKDTNNVKNAMADLGINYPVVQDNSFTIWRAYDNHYWPAHYLIDKEGRIRYTHFGEGKYEETENQIRELLGEAPLEQSSLSQPESIQYTTNQTPETYLGYGRASAYANTSFKNNQVSTYSFTPPLAIHQVGLTGQWKVESESITAVSASASLDLRYRSQNVYLVMSHTDEVTDPKVSITLDDQFLRQINIDKSQKYDIVKATGDNKDHLLHLEFDPGVMAFAFTFGQ